MNVRVKTEEIERQVLSPLATLSCCSRGRLVQEEPCAIRTCFQRDRDRIIHSKAFRRLKHKTQVFISPEGDHYRTRLTHTLEVAQIGRTIARALRLNEDLVEAIALAHDLGHTPFGHAGEEVLDRLLDNGFRHNIQSLRVIDCLEGGRGLNCTFEVRDGVVNHTGDKLPQTLEGQVVRLADRIAYINHDIDDSLRAGILTPADLPAREIEILGETHSQRINTMVKDTIVNSMGQTSISMSPEVGGAMDKLRSFLFETVYIGSVAKAEEDKAKGLIERLFEHYYKHPEQLPELERKRLESAPLDVVIADYVSGMTDRFIIDLYQSIFIPRSWPVK